MRQIVTKYQPPGVINKAGEIFVDEVTGQIKIGDGVTTNGKSLIVTTVTSAQIITGTLGNYLPEHTYVTADTSGGVDKGTLVRWSSELNTWVFDFYRSASVI